MYRWRWVRKNGRSTLKKLSNTRRPVFLSKSIYHTLFLDVWLAQTTKKSQITRPKKTPISNTYGTERLRVSKSSCVNTKHAKATCVCSFSGLQWLLFLFLLLILCSETFFPPIHTVCDPPYTQFPLFHPPPPYIAILSLIIFGGMYRWRWVRKNGRSTLKKLSNTRRPVFLSKSSYHTLFLEICLCQMTKKSQISPQEKSCGADTIFLGWGDLTVLGPLTESDVQKQRVIARFRNENRFLYVR